MYQAQVAEDKTSYSVTLGIGTAITESVTTVVEKGVMQDTEETALGTMEIGLI